VDLAQALLSGNRRALAQALTLVETGGPRARALLGVLFAHTGRAHIIGVTGAPGAGKSTLVAALAAHWRRAGRTVGIIAVDPTSPFTRGAILGDRIRMQALSGDPGDVHPQYGESRTVWAVLRAPPVMQ
jgi:LAO/AO transport system kinase